LFGGVLFERIENPLACFEGTFEAGLVEVVEELSWGDDFTACEAAEDGGDDIVGWGVVSVFQARGIVFLIHVAKTLITSI
jgi:hypothetical protein